MSVAYYEKNAERFAADTRAVDMSGLYAPFLEQLTPDALILDAGCGTGRDSLNFQRQGYRVEAFDASPRMAAMAGELTGLTVPAMSFQDVRAIDRYEGIWCCASLLHVPAAEFQNVGKRLVTALRQEGVWYLSFKYGEGERRAGERLFVDHTEETLRQALAALSAVDLVDLWVTEDKRPNRSDERWINALVKKR